MPEISVNNRLKYEKNRSQFSMAAIHGWKSWEINDGCAKDSVKPIRADSYSTT